jgi:hypothetical protein
MAEPQHIAGYFYKGVNDLMARFGVSFPATSSDLASQTTDNYITFQALEPNQAGRRIENPRVGGSIPSLVTTKKQARAIPVASACFLLTQLIIQPASPSPLSTAYNQSSLAVSRQSFLHR